VTGRRWGVAGVSSLAAVLAVVLAWQAFAGSGCASAATAAPRAQLLAAAGTSGRATFYDLQAMGNCSYPKAPANGLFVALGPAQYAGAAGCGSFLDVTGPKGTVRVKVVDKCPECASGHLDLSRTAFTRIADPVQGNVSIRFRQVANPRLANNLSFRVKEGSSQFWLAILVDDHGNQLRKVEVKRGSAWVSLQRAEFNYWITDGGAGAGPFTIRVTDAQGNRATAKGIRLAPGETQRSAVRMYGAAAKESSAPVSGATGKQATGSKASAKTSQPAAKAKPAAVAQRPNSQSDGAVAASAAPAAGGSTGGTPTPQPSLRAAGAPRAAPTEPAARC
jgi:expansin (peptidoglycan-binding protein)